MRDPGFLESKKMWTIFTRASFDDKPVWPKWNSISIKISDKNLIDEDHFDHLHLYHN